jgi:hypothetical protein
LSHLPVVLIPLDAKGPIGDSSSSSSSSSSQFIPPAQLPHLPCTIIRPDLIIRTTRVPWSLIAAEFEEVSSGFAAHISTLNYIILSSVASY